MTARGAWTTTYFASWAVALAPAGGAGLMALAAARDAHGEMWVVLGAIGGVMAGLVVAACTQASGRLHRALRVMGPVLLTAGGLAAVALFLASAEQKKTGQFLAGFGEFVFAVLGMAVALTGGCLWLAGASGPRAMPG